MKNKNHFGKLDFDYDAIMIESKDKNVNINSMVCISPFNTKTRQWLCGLMIITSMKSALMENKKKVSKDANVEKFLENYYKRKSKH